VFSEPLIVHPCLLLSGQTSTTAELAIMVGELRLTTPYAHLETVSGKCRSMSGQILILGPFVPGYIYTTKMNMSIDDLKKYGNLIMGCQDTAVNKVNGRVTNENNDSICLSNGGGCNDCL